MYVVQATMFRNVGWATIRFQGLTRPLSVLREIRRLPGVVGELAMQLQGVAQALGQLIELQSQAGAADDRLDELERTRARWEAEMEALLLKADSTLKSASNAESRSRTMMKHAEKLADPLDIEGEEEPEAVPAGYAPGSEEERLQPMRLDVAPTHKENALRYKFT